VVIFFYATFSFCAETCAHFRLLIQMASTLPRTTDVSVGDTVIRAKTVNIKNAVYVTGTGQFIKNANINKLTISGCNIASELIKAETSRVTPTNQVSNIHFTDRSITDAKFSGIIPVTLGGTGLANVSAGSILSGSYVSQTIVNVVSAVNVNNTSVRFDGMGLRFVDDNSNVFTLTTNSTGLIISNSNSMLQSYLSDSSMGVPPSISNIQVLQTSDTTVRVGVSVVDSDADMRYLYLGWSSSQNSIPQDHETIMSGAGFLSNIIVPVPLNYSSHTSVVDIPNLVKRTDYTIQAFVDDIRGNVSVPFMFDIRTQDVDIPIFSSFVVSCTNAVVKVDWNAVDEGGLVTNVYLKQSSTPLTQTPLQVKSGATFTTTLSNSTINLTNTPSWCNTYVYGVAEDNASTYGQASNLLSEVSSGAITVPVIPGSMTRNYTNANSNSNGYMVNMSSISSVTSMTNTIKVYYTLFPQTYSWNNTDSNIGVITGSPNSVFLNNAVIPVPTIPSNFVTSLSNMDQGMFGGTGFSATPYTGIKNLPKFLVGVPMTKAINSNVYACAFDVSPIHAYGFRMAPNWAENETGTDIIYSGTKYDGVGVEVINQVVYKSFVNPIFNISTYSYIWFFTTTPRADGYAALNA
jgi:hypothetical protein